MGKREKTIYANEKMLVSILREGEFKQIKLNPMEMMELDKHVMDSDKQEMNDHRSKTDSVRNEKIYLYS